MLFNLRFASNSLHQLARNPNWQYAIRAKSVQSLRNYVTQYPQMECNFISRQLKNPSYFCKNLNRTDLVLRSYSKAGVGNGKATDKSRKMVGYWLLGCSGMVFVAVALGGTIYYSICNVLEEGLKKSSQKVGQAYRLVFIGRLRMIAGGVTRLTESGLSMVTWKLLGENLPRSEQAWISEFEKYKQFPEYQIKNADMTLSEFKRIWYMEYAHRTWGRFIGAAFAVPAIYFWSRGYFNKGMKTRVLVFGALIGVQGLMGWYMVKSGLEDRFHNPNDVPRVSQYRLATHLSFAFLLYTAFLWSALDHLLPAQQLAVAASKQALRFRGLAHGTKGFIFLTAISGAFVAGLDAGLVYNSFPKMANQWIPSDILALSPTLKNFTENPTTVQFDHRILGITTLSLISGLYLLSRRAVLPKRAYSAATALAVMGWAQVALGITTLLTYVPVPIAAAHQSGSLMLLSFAIWLTHELKLLKHIPK